MMPNLRRLPLLLSWHAALMFWKLHTVPQGIDTAIDLLRLIFYSATLKLESSPREERLVDLAQVFGGRRQKQLISLVSPPKDYGQLGQGTFLNENGHC